MSDEKHWECWHCGHKAKRYISLAEHFAVCPGVVRYSAVLRGIQYRDDAPTLADFTDWGWFSPEAT